MARLLYLLPGLVPPPADHRHDRYFYLSEILEGDVLLPTWFRSTSEAKARIGDRFPTCRVGSFTYHLFLTWRFVKPLRGLARFVFYLQRGLQLHRAAPFHAIAAYGTSTPGIAAAVLKLLTGLKLIIEVPGPPDTVYLTKPRITLMDRLKQVLSELALHISAGAADCLYLRYPSQLAKYPLLRAKPAVVFPNLVPVRSFSAERTDTNTVLLVGAPWYLKGVDIAIKAFQLIADRVPQHKLRLIGHYPDRQVLEEIARGCERIEFVKPVTDYQESLRRIASCTIFVLASRTDAMARVLLEAMAAEKAIIASAVDGFPFYIKDGDNGLLFPSEDVQALAERMLELLENPELRARIARNAYERVRAEFDERSFVRNFEKLIEMIGVRATASTAS
jgi:glycosyltransferase involved in cell wall biosynthesis